MISVVELTKRFTGGGTDVLAVDRLSFSVAEGEVYGLLGPNGAGKTTTLRMILGLVAPTSGYAEVAGFRTSESADEVKRRVGFVTADAGLYQSLTPRELLLFFADLYGVPLAQAGVELEHLSRTFELGEFMDRRCATLSAGQRQRVNLARALIHDPPIVLLDEPTQGLDVLGSQVIFDYVNLVRRRGKSVVISTHRLDEAQRLCDRFGLLHRGQLVLQGALSDLRDATQCETLVDMFLQFLGPSRSAEISSQ
jgi:ABC-2 type transport system ATP-binding protein/sodium transport system ATP-binding protein